MKLEVQNLCVTRSGHTLLKDVSFTACDGEWWMLVGPNGAGKTTLLNAISGGIPFNGSVRLDQLPVAEMRASQRARKMAVMEQHTSILQPFTLREVVSMGRYAYRNLRGGDRDGEKIITQAIRDTGLDALQDRSVLTLSGGEAQRMMLAQVLCQQPELLMLDEPGNNLDLAALRQIFDLTDSWRKATGRGVISVVHDLSLAMRYGTHALLLDRGQVIACGPIRSVLSRDNLKQVWQMDVAGWMRELNTIWDQLD